MSDFSEYVGNAARAAGYDIDSPRGGGRKALAEATGMSQASVSRMLAGKTAVDTRCLPAIAEALNAPIEDLLRLVGLLEVAPTLEQQPVTKAVAGELTAIRREQKVSAQELADRMTNLGYPIKRSVIANIESGRRAEISLDHLAVAAAALGVDAATLLRHVTAPCPNCKGEPPAGFTCNTCGGAA
jgi:transcriptional regulator with XRE-family HTH domain